MGAGSSPSSLSSLYGLGGCCTSARAADSSAFPPLGTVLLSEGPAPTSPIRMGLFPAFLPHPPPPSPPPRSPRGSLRGRGREGGGRPGASPARDGQLCTHTPSWPTRWVGVSTPVTAQSCWCGEQGDPSPPSRLGRQVPPGEALGGGAGTGRGVMDVGKGRAVLATCGG